MATKIKLQMNPINQIIEDKGLAPNGVVQNHLTFEVNRRIGRYMPHLTGVLEHQLKRVISGTQIKIEGPYARYQYYGGAMEGKPPKHLTGMPLEYTKTFNTEAGPFWDRRMMAAEGAQIAADLQEFVRLRRR